MIKTLVNRYNKVQVILFLSFLFSRKIKALKIIEIKRDSRLEKTIKVDLNLEENKKIKTLCLELAKTIIPAGYPNLNKMEILNDFDQDQTFLIFQSLAWNQNILAEVKYELTKASETLEKSNENKQEIKALKEEFEEAYGTFLEIQSIINLEQVLYVGIKQARFVQDYFLKRIVLNKNNNNQISFYFGEDPESILGTKSIVSILPKLINERKKNTSKNKHLEKLSYGNEILKKIKNLDEQSSQRRKKLSEAVESLFSLPSLVDYCTNFLVKNEIL